jgi:hypothetical protein
MIETQWDDIGTQASDLWFCAPALTITRGKINSLILRGMARLRRFELLTSGSGDKWSIQQTRCFQLFPAGCAISELFPACALANSIRLCAFGRKVKFRPLTSRSRARKIHSQTVCLASLTRRRTFFPLS